MAAKAARSQAALRGYCEGAGSPFSASKTSTALASMETPISAPCGGTSASRTRARIGASSPCTASSTRAMSPRKRASSTRAGLPGAEQPHAALAHANDGVGAVGQAVGQEAAEWSGGTPLLHAGGKLVQVGEGARGEDILGRAVEVKRIAGLYDTPCPHQRHAVAHAHRLLGVVGNDDRGGTRLMQDGERLLAHFFPKSRVETRERLVHQKHARAGRDGAGERHALLLAAGEDMRIFVGIVGEADAIQRRMSLGLGFAASKRSQPEGGIVEDREMGKEREVLEHQPDAPLLWRNEALRPPHLLLVEKNAACAWPLDAGRNPEQCGLAARSE